MNGLLLTVSRRALVAAGPPLVEVSMVDMAVFYRIPQADLVSMVDKVIFFRTPQAVLGSMVDKAILFRKIPSVNAAPTALHWRVVTHEQFGEWMEFTGVEFRTTAGVAETHSGSGTPFSTNQWNVGARPPANVFDGNTATFCDWRGTVPSVIGFSFSSAKTVSEVALITHTTANRGPTRFTLEYSHDNVEWHMAREYRAVPTFGASETRLFSTFDVASTKPPVAAAVSATYWRVYIVDTGDPNWAEISEVEFRTVKGTPETHSGGTAFASSEYPGWPASNAFNGDGTTTRWSSVANGESGSHLGYQFAASKTVRQVAIQAPTNNGFSPLEFYIQHSNNGTSWTTAYSSARPAGFTAGAVSVFDIA